jgi:hypothetical protein
VLSVICGRTRTKRLAYGIPLDPNTLARLRGAARAAPAEVEIERGIIPMEPTRQS